MPDAAADAITAYMTAHPPVEVTLPWMVIDGKPTTVPLLLTTRERSALNRNYFNTYIWRPALTRAEVPDIRANGCHALRTYTHLMEGSAERTKKAIDAAFRGEVGPVTPSDEGADVDR